LHHDLAGKVALVTGGSRGIGAAVARALAGAGADVAITYLNSRQAAENVAEEMYAMGVRARSIRADQADPAAASAVVRQVAEEFGRLDILVNNAVTWYGTVPGHRSTKSLARCWSALCRDPVTSQAPTAPGGGSRRRTSSDGPITLISANPTRHDTTSPDAAILRYTETASDRRGHIRLFPNFDAVALSLITAGQRGTGVLDTSHRAYRQLAPERRYITRLVS
jgi:3-oxoacyl-[acyl-carrier protein] reductase